MNKFLQRIIRWFLYRIPFQDLKYVYDQRNPYADYQYPDLTSDQKQQIRKEMESFIESRGELFKYSLDNMYCPQPVAFGSNTFLHPRLPISCLMGESKVIIESKISGY